MSRAGALYFRPPPPPPLEPQATLSFPPSVRPYCWFLRSFVLTGRRGGAHAAAGDGDDASRHHRPRPLPPSLGQTAMPARWRGVCPYCPPPAAAAAVNASECMSEIAFCRNIYAPLAPRSLPLPLSPSVGRPVARRCRRATTIDEEASSLTCMPAPSRGGPRRSEQAKQGRETRAVCRPHPPGSATARRLCPVESSFPLADHRRRRQT